MTDNLQGITDAARRITPEHEASALRPMIKGLELTRMRENGQFSSRIEATGGESELLFIRRRPTSTSESGCRVRSVRTDRQS